MADFYAALPRQNDAAPLADFATALNIQAAELLAPAIIRDLGNADRPHRVRDRLTLRNQHIDLPQLRDDLFRLVTFPRHWSPPACLNTYLRVDPFSGGGSKRAIPQMNTSGADGCARLTEL